MTESSPKPLKKREEDGRSRILTAALEVFSTVGFDGTSLRHVAERAGTQHQLIVYHFKTKDALWKAVVNRLCADAAQNALKSVEAARAHGPASALRALVSAFARFTATRPQFHRIVTFEGCAHSERLDWLMQTYTRAAFALSTGLIREAQTVGAARGGDPARLHYALVGLVTSSFVMATEYRAMTGRDPFDEAEVAAVIELGCDFLGL